MFTFPFVPSRPSVDDAEVLKKELASVQRLMNELTVAKETELGDLKKELFNLQLEYGALKEKYSRNDQDTSADVPVSFTLHNCGPLPVV